MTPVVLIDPALGRTGAHNRGFAELMAGERGMGGRGVCGNMAMDAALRASLASRCSLVETLFDVDFYALAGRPGGAADHWDWIYGLSRGYMAAFERILARWPTRKVRLLYHTLSWEHANALALAVRAFGARGAGFQHVVLLMYSPGLDATGRVLDARRHLNFRLAFRALHSAGDVLLFASCSEYAEAYRHLLDIPSPLPLHPCFIGDWRRPRPVGRADVERDVLMYVGEIKQDKGFLQLPERLRQELAVPGPTRKFVLQFAAVRTPAARAVVDELRALAAGHANVEVHEGFWSDTQLEAAFRDAGMLHLDYDAAAYANKTSGLLWLAAWYGLSVTVPSGTWLEREAHRLGVPVITAGNRARPVAGQVDPRAKDVAYFHALFRPFWPWLAELPAPAGEPTPGPEIARAIEAATSARCAPLPVGQGADVVVFWKQNDSGLYGRRNDMVVRYLASRPEIRRVVVVDAPIAEARLAALAAERDPVRHDRWIAERTLDKLAGRCDYDKIAHVVYAHSRVAGGSDADHPTPGFLAAYGDFLAGEFARLRIASARSVFWAYPKNFALPALLDRFAPARLVLDIVDDHRAWPGVDEVDKRRLGEHYRELLMRADLALANCIPVQKAMASLGREPQLVPNGCDAALPRTADWADAALREQLDFRGRTLGFVGNLEAKIDIPLLSRLAETFADCRLVLIGSTHANPDVLALRRYPNVRMPGIVPYDDLGAWLSSFDVGLIPHLHMDLTRFMNPLKTYVYLANGVPVVATAVPNIESVAGLVKIAQDADAFVAAVAEQLAQGRPPRERFEAAAAPHRWASRLDPVLVALDLRSLTGSPA